MAKKTISQTTLIKELRSSNKRYVDQIKQMSSWSQEQRDRYETSLVDLRGQLNDSRLEQARLSADLKTLQAEKQELERRLNEQAIESARKDGKIEVQEALFDRVLETLDDHI